MMGLKVHLIIYGILVSMLTVSGLAAKHYYTESVLLVTAYNTLEASYKMEKENSKRLEDLFDAERKKSEVIETEHAKALAQLHEMGERNAQVKAYFDIDVPTELNDRLRAKYPASQNGKNRNPKKSVKRLSQASIHRYKNKTRVFAQRGTKQGHRQLQQEPVLIATIERKKVTNFGQQ